MTARCSPAGLLGGGGGGGWVRERQMEEEKCSVCVCVLSTFVCTMSPNEMEYSMHCT